MGGTISYSIRKNWKQILLSLVKYFIKMNQEGGVRTISESDLKQSDEDISDDIIKFFEKINIINNISRKSGGKKAKRGSYELTETGYKLYDMFENKDMKYINKHLHLLLINNYYQYRFLLDFLREKYHLFNVKNLKLTRNELRNQLLDFLIHIYGTSEFIDEQTYANIYNFAINVELIKVKTEILEINTVFFGEINYEKLKEIVERELKSNHEGMITHDLCEHLISVQTSFYYGRDLAISEIYQFLQNIYLSKIKDVNPFFSFHGGLTYPPITSPHSIIKLGV